MGLDGSFIPSKNIHRKQLGYKSYKDMVDAVNHPDGEEYPGMYREEKREIARVEGKPFDDEDERYFATYP